jgi:hypothetical protein
MSVDIDPELCFVLMPLREQFQEIYEEIVKPTVEMSGLVCEHAGEIFGARLIIEDIWDRLERARVVVAELTGRNANVFYEVGYAHCLDKRKVILITQSMDDVPFDLRGFRCVEYGLGPRGLNKLRTKLKGMIEAVLADRPGSSASVTKKGRMAALDLYDALQSLEQDVRLELLTRVYWPRLVAAVQARSRNLAAILVSCAPVLVEEGTLVLRAPSQFHKEKLESQKAKALLQDEFEKFLGARLAVRLQVVRQTKGRETDPASPLSTGGLS